MTNVPNMAMLSVSKFRDLRLNLNHQDVARYGEFDFDYNCPGVLVVVKVVIVHVSFSSTYDWGLFPASYSCVLTVDEPRRFSWVSW